MSFWQGLKAMFGFSRDIGVSEDISGYLIFPLKLKNKKLTLNKKLIVPKNFALVIVSEGKILDVFPEGEHMLGVVSLPEASKKFKLYKPDKDGNPINSFPCDAFYVNLNLQEKQPFTINKKLRFKTSVDGRYWIKPRGELNFKIINVKLFFASILQISPKIKLSKLDGIMQDFFEEPIIQTFKKENYLYSSFTENVDVLEEAIIPKLNKILIKQGVEVTRIDFLEHDVSKNIQRREERKKQQQEELNIKQQKEQYLQDLNQSQTNMFGVNNDLNSSNSENNSKLCLDEKIFSANWVGLESLNKGKINLNQFETSLDCQFIQNQINQQKKFNGLSDDCSTNNCNLLENQNISNIKAKWEGIDELNNFIKKNKK